jgi:DNA-binding HxlR family transcriptional regulator
MLCASGNQSHLEEVEDADSVRLQHGPVRLGELRRMFPEASKKMLTQHLRETEKRQPRHWEGFSGRLLHVGYFLSDSLGFAVLHLITTLTK